MIQPAHRPFDPAEPDLGTLPPLMADGRQQIFSRRTVSLRWLSGAVLTALTSAFLMGGALFAALDGRQSLASTPDDLGVVGPVDAELRIRQGAFSAGSGALAKSDRLKLATDQFASRQLLNLSTLTRVGDRDLVRMKPFVRVAASLTLKKTDAMARFPAYNAQAAFNANVAAQGRASDVRNPAFYDAKVDGEVALKTTALPIDPRTFDTGAIIQTSEVERIVREQAKFLSDGSIRSGFIASGTDGLIQVPTDQKTAMQMRIDVENVTYLPKSDRESAGAQAGNGFDDKTVNLGNNDSLRSVLKDNNADDKMIGDITAAIAKRTDPKRIDGSYRLRLGVAKIDQTDLMKPVRVSVYNQAGHIVTVAMGDDGEFVVAQEPEADDAPVPVDEDEEKLATEDQVPTLYASLYQTALQNEVPENLIKDLVLMYSSDVDLTARVRPGDTFELFYAVDDTGKTSSAGEILFTAMKVKGQIKKLYRYRTSDDGLVDYFDEQGKSGKKFMTRKPMDGGDLRSGFGGRKHPILGYYRMHTGVDWASPTGTPVYAAGDGVVEEAQWKGGYGRFLKLSHANGYGSGYGHLSGYAKGIDKGTKVKQGQVVAYVGSTGLSTGPHLHYEVYINGVAVDPLRVKLPRGKELNGQFLADYKRERDRIDAMLARFSSGGKVVAQR